MSEYLRWFLIISLLVLLFYIIRYLIRTVQTEREAISLFILFIIALTGLTLPFHYAPTRGLIFPKDNLTFSYTFITENDINEIIERHNNAGFIERAAISNEPFVRKLIEKHIIVERDKENEEIDK